MRIRSRLQAPRPRRQPVTRSRAGFALEATLVVLILVAVLVGLAATWMLGVTRTGALDYRGARVSYAAEAGADAIMAQLEIAIEDGLLSDAELGALTLPTLGGFTFEDMTARRVGSPVVRPITSGNFAGLMALNQAVEIQIAARDAAANRGAVVVTVNAQSIPLFQFGVFYEEDLEIHPGAPMTFAGWVHTNKNLYLSSASSYFESRITTPDSVFWIRKNSTEKLNGVYIDDEGGNDVALRFDSRTISNEASFRARSEADFDGRLMTKAHGVTPLRLPLPGGVPAIELIRPRTGTDDAQAQAVKFAWKADWHIEVDLSNTSQLCKTTNGIIGGTARVGKVKPSEADCKTIFKWDDDAFFEGREDIRVDALDIFVDSLRLWRNGSPTQRETRIMYVTFKNAPAGGYPIVRLRNGSRLPNPFTIATSHPLYVQGNYNTNTWQPASLLGDAITFLSPNWNDASQATFAKRAASSMSVFAAIAAGHSATPCDNQRAGCSNPPYGGGLENFPRFLEDWGGKTMTYRGSLVSLFTSEKAKRKNWNWRSPVYYNAPNRDWEFDIRFQDPDLLPPGTPTVGSVFQTAYRPVF